MPPNPTCICRREIARNVQAAATGTADVSGNIAEVGQAAEETGEGAQNILVAATDLSRQAENLSGRVTDFLSGVRAA